MFIAMREKVIEVKSIQALNEVLRKRRLIEKGLERNKE